jgi:hypothetical protein
MTYSVSASHHSPTWALINQSFADVASGEARTDFRVDGDSVNGYYASAPSFGCGKSYPSHAQAIHALLADNGCTNIRITVAPSAPAKPLAKSLHTVTVLVRVAHEVRNRQFPPLPTDSAVTRALDILGLTGQPDSYGLALQAEKQLNKFS